MLQIFPGVLGFCHGIASVVPTRYLWVGCCIKVLIFALRKHYPIQILIKGKGLCECMHVAPSSCYTDLRSDNKLMCRVTKTWGSIIYSQ